MIDEKIKTAKFEDSRTILTLEFETKFLDSNECFSALYEFKPNRYVFNFVSRYSEIRDAVSASKKLNVPNKTEKEIQEECIKKEIYDRLWLTGWQKHQEDIFNESVIETIRKNIFDTQGI